MISRLARLLVCVAVFGVAESLSVAPAATLTWDGDVNNLWADGLNPGNWNPSDEPDPGDTAVFNTSTSVDMASPNTVLGLNMSGGISLTTNGHGLTVDGLAQLAGVSTDLFVNGGDSILQADAVIVNSGADIHLEGGNILTVGSPAPGGIYVNIGGEITGYGLIFLGDQVASPTSVMTLDGVLTAEGPAGLRGVPLAGTLKIIGNGSNSRLNLDGAGGGGDGIVNVSRNATLDIDVQLNDPFDGTINLAANSKLDMASPWTFAGAGVSQINVNTGGSTAATISGAAFTQTGGSINVDAGDMLQISSSTFTATNGTINNSGHIIFDSDTTTNISGNTFHMTGPTASLTVNPDDDVFIDSNDLELDGAGTATNVVTIGTGGRLNLSLSGAADESFTGTINLNGGTLFVITNDNDWSLGGAVNVSATPTSLIAGEQVTFSANTTIAAGAALVINAPTIYDGDLAVAGSGLLIQNIAASANGTPTIEVGTFRANAPVTVNPGATLLVDVDHINDPSDEHRNTFEINSGTLEVSVDDGEWQLGTVGGASGTINFRQSSITPTLEGASTLRVAQGTIDVDGGATIFVPTILEQTSSNYGTLRFVGDGGLASLAGHLQLRGGDIHDITDDPAVDTQLHLIGGMTVSGPAASGVFVDTFRWDLSPTTIETGAYFGVYADKIEPIGSQTYDNLITINQGTLHVDLGNHASWIMDGYLDLDRGTVGGLNEVTPGGDAIEIGDDAGTDVTLNVSPGTSTFNSFVTFNSDAYVYLESGAQLDMNAGVVFSPVNGANNGVFTGGAGTWLFLGPVTFAEATTMYMPSAYLAFSSDINDNTALIAPVTMSLDTMGNFNGLMTISAPGRLTVNLTDPNGEWTIGGTATINSGGNAPSDIFLAGSDINHNGTMNINGEGQIAARLDIGSLGEINIIDADGSLTLSGGSLSDPNTISGGGEINGPGDLIVAPGTALTIGAGAAFTGGGSLINLNGATLTVHDGAMIGVTLQNEGVLVLGASPGQVSAVDFAQTAAGAWNLELGGVASNEVDSLTLTGDAALAGALNLALLPGFAPTAGQAFNILTAPGGVTGAFTAVAQPPTMPTGLLFDVIYTPALVQLMVVNAPIFTADLNGDGTVNGADLAQWQGDFGVNDLSDADGDGDSDGADFLAWQRQLGSSLPINATSAAVPEPTTTALLVAATLAVSLRRRRLWS